MKLHQILVLACAIGLSACATNDYDDHPFRETVYNDQQAPGQPYGTEVDGKRVTINPNQPYAQQQMAPPVYRAAPAVVVIEPNYYQCPTGFALLFAPAGCSNGGYGYGYRPYYPYSYGPSLNFGFRLGGGGHRGGGNGGWHGGNHGGGGRHH